jgi:cell shape-determining protein MreD
VYDVLAVPAMIVALLVAAWCFVAAARQRWIDMSHLVGLAVVELAMLAQAVVALVHLASGERPVELATFIGYLATSVLLLPLAAVLSFMERTRWGSVVAGSAALVSVVLVLRLRQVWRG